MKISTKNIILLVAAIISSAAVGTVFLGSLVGYVALSLCIACLAALIYSTNSYYPLLSLVPVFALSVILSSFYVSAATTLIIALAAMPIATIPGKLKNRTIGIAQSVIMMSIACAFVFGVFLFIKTNEVSVSSLRGLYEPYVDQIKATLTEFLAQGEFDDEIVKSSTEYLDLFVKTTVLHLPSILALIMMLIAYVGTVLFKPTIKLLKLGDSLDGTKWEIAPSKTASVIYFISYLAMIFFGTGEDIVSIAASNVMIIFTPAFVIVGARVLLAWIRSRKSKGFKILCYITAIFSLIFNLSMFLTLFATSGAIINFVLRKRAASSDFNK